jgi:hypothetical protein
MAVDRSAGISKRGKPPAIEAHDVKFHGEEREGTIPGHENPDWNAGIFDDLFEHLSFRTHRIPACQLVKERAFRVTFVRNNQMRHRS